MISTVILLSGSNVAGTSGLRSNEVVSLILYTWLERNLSEPLYGEEKVQSEITSSVVKSFILEVSFFFQCSVWITSSLLGIISILFNTLSSSQARTLNYVASLALS